MNVEGQRFQQDAQAEINELSQQLQNEFQQKLFPILDLVAKEKGIDLLLSAADAGHGLGGSRARPDDGCRQEARREDGREARGRRSRAGSGSARHQALTAIT